MLITYGKPGSLIIPVMSLLEIINTKVSLQCRLELIIGIEGLCVLIVARAVAVWEQLFLSQISEGTALHVPLNKIGSISPAANSLLSAVIANSRLRSLRIFSWTIQVCIEGLGHTMSHHRLCTTR